jgi:hypothetical protein
MRLARTLAAALMATVFVPPSVTWAAGPPGAGTLHGRQTLVGHRTATRAVVSVPQAVRLPGHANCLLSDTAVFSGTAQQAAVFLTSLPLTPDSSIIWIAHVTLEGRRKAADSECLSTRIPAGRYLLQYLHTPGTSSVRLTLPGLPGTGTLALSKSDASVIEQLPPVIDGPADPATKTWGTRRGLAARGSILSLGVIEAGGTDKGYALEGDCVTGTETEALPDAVVYGPGCPSGSSGIGYGFTGQETWQATVSSNLAAGSYAVGYWMVGSPTHQPLGAISVWLTNLTG